MDPPRGIYLLQQLFRVQRQMNVRIFVRILKCQEVAMSIQKNVNHQFTVKKITPTEYHHHLCRLAEIQEGMQEIADSSFRLIKRHIKATKLEHSLNELLSRLSCYDVHVLFNWLTDGEWETHIFMEDSDMAEKIDFIERYFVPLRFTASPYDDDDDHDNALNEYLVIESHNDQTQITYDHFIGNIQIKLYGSFKKDSVHLALTYTFYKSKYTTIVEELNNTHIPLKFRTMFLDQMKVDSIMGKDIDEIVSTVLTAYSNAKEYKTMPLNILVSHFMGGNLKLKAYMLTLLLLLDDTTNHIATVLFDYLLNDETLSHMTHDLYCAMHWTIQKNFEMSYNKTEHEIKTINASDKIPYDKRILISHASPEAKAKASDKLKVVNSPEGGTKAQQWLDGFLKLPFEKYRSHIIIDKLDSFKQKAANYIPKMKKIGEPYASFVDGPVVTSYHLAKLVANIKKAHAGVDYRKLSTDVLVYNPSLYPDDATLSQGFPIPTLTPSRDGSGNGNGNGSGDEPFDAKAALAQLQKQDKSMSYKFPFSMTLPKTSSSFPSLTLPNLPKGIFSDESDNSSSSFDEKISLVNGSLQKTRSYKPVNPDSLFSQSIFGQSDNKPAPSEYFSRKTLFLDLNRLCNEWEEYEIEKRVYLGSIKDRLDEACYGHDDAKVQIQRLVAQWINGSMDGTVIGIQGPPGNGKTTLAKMGMSKCLIDSDGTPRPFAMIALGGSSNASTLVGHNFTYVGSTWGKIVDILIEKQCMNPIIYIDEVDKISRTEHGREITGILTHLTDSTQNDHFEDRYFSGIPFNLSKALIIMSFNDSSLIDPILRDRMHIIKTNPLSAQDKIEVVNRHVLPDIVRKVGFSDEDIVMTKDTILYIINSYTYEAGVRKLKELLYEIIREVNLRSICDSSNDQFPLEITVEMAKDILRKKHFLRVKTIHDAPCVGLINGLYATGAGIGGITTIEVKRAYSKSFLDLILTGSQGDVMQESIKCARTIAWGMLPDNIKETFLTKDEDDKTDDKDAKDDPKNNPDTFALHVHTPDCGTPKDGPSAGAAITLGILSQLAQIPINNQVAMTGEIDLHGNVTMIGGLESKIRGALRAGVKKVLIPLDNKQDLDDIIRDERITEITDSTVDFTVLTVSHITEMTSHVFTSPLY